MQAGTHALNVIRTRDPRIGADEHTDAIICSVVRYKGRVTVNILLVLLSAWDHFILIVAPCLHQNDL
jgi:hypothetical protein